MPLTINHLRGTAQSQPLNNAYQRDTRRPPSTNSFPSDTVNRRSLPTPSSHSNGLPSHAADFGVLLDSHIHNARRWEAVAPSAPPRDYRDKYVNEDLILDEDEEEEEEDEDEVGGEELHLPQDPWIKQYDSEHQPDRAAPPLRNSLGEIGWKRQEGIERDGEDEDEEDDGEMLAILLRRAEQMRQGGQNAPPIATHTGVHTPTDDAVGVVDLMANPREKEEEDRRQRAIDFLENLVISFLTSTHLTLRSVNQRKRNQHSKRPKLPTKLASQTSKKRKASMTDQEHDDGTEHVAREEPAQASQERSEKRSTSGKAKEQSSSQGSDKSQEGVVMITKNRKTGGDQIIKFPEDPVGIIKAEETAPSALDKMAAILRVAALLHEAILTNTPTTKRDIYYKDVRLFKEQRTVDKIVDDLAATAGLKRADFCVCATSKGLVSSGVLRLYLKTGEELSMSASLAALIHPSERIGRIEAVEPLSWVLIVEKDAVFNTLLNAKLLVDDRIGHGVVITGKGYPDLATLQLASRLADLFPNATFHALVDADPHGIDILSNYTFGSQASKFSHDHTGLALGDRLQWMGVRASEWLEMGVAYDDLLPLSDRDVSKAMKMLRDRPNMPASWTKELCHTLHLNRKAEIEIIMSAETEGEVGAGDMDQRGVETGGGNKLVEYIVRRLQRYE